MELTCNLCIVDAFRLWFRPLRNEQDQKLFRLFSAIVAADGQYGP